MKRVPKFSAGDVVLFRDFGGVLGIGLISEVRNDGILHYRFYKNGKVLYEENIYRIATTEDRKNFDLNYDDDLDRELSAAIISLWGS